MDKFHSDWEETLKHTRLEAQWNSKTYIDNEDKVFTCREPIIENVVETSNEEWRIMMKKLRKEPIEIEAEEETSIMQEEEEQVEATRQHIIRKYDVDYNIFMKLGRERRYKVIAYNWNETWRNRSKTMWINYWKKYNCYNWINLIFDTNSETQLLDLDCTFR
jgi:hypothetical protein